MNWIQSLKHRHSLRTFKKRSRKVKFPHQFIALGKAKTVGFIININLYTSEDLILLTHYLTKLEDKGKKIFLVELNFKRKSLPMFTQTNQSIFINPAHINWMGFPSVQKLKAINTKKCDILLNLDHSENMTSRYICGFSNAKTRVGIHEEEFEKVYELMLQISPETGLKTMLNQFETYLKMIEK